MTASRFVDRSQAIYLGSSIDTHKKDGLVQWVDGTVTTQYGYVLVYSQGYTGTWSKHSTFTFAWKGREHVRRFTRVFTKRGLVTIARRFARDVASRGTA